MQVMEKGSEQDSEWNEHNVLSAMTVPVGTAIAEVVWGQGMNQGGLCGGEHEGDAVEPEVRVTMCEDVGGMVPVYMTDGEVAHMVAIWPVGLDATWKDVVADLETQTRQCPMGAMFSVLVVDQRPERKGQGWRDGARVRVQCAGVMGRPGGAS